MTDCIANHLQHSATWTPGVIRGGRVTKWKGHVASYAPQLGTIIARTALALGTALASGLILPGAAMAGTCVAGLTGVTCSGAASATDTTQTITSTGGATVTSEPGFGATVASGDAINITSNGPLTFSDTNAATITGTDNGLVAQNNGAGAITLSSNGSITGTRFSGIFAVQSAAGTDLTVSANNTSGYYNGIKARNLGTGALSVTSTGTATGGDGINAYQSAAGTDLTVNAYDVTGYYNGIKAESLGTGVLSVTSTGKVTGRWVDGINASQSAAGTDLTVNAYDTSGYQNGIKAKNFGSGALSVTSTGTATGTHGDGIYAYQSAAGTDLTVTSTYNTSGGAHGILAKNLGSGALSVTSAGTASGGRDGINANQSAAGTDLTVRANNVDGSYSGIWAVSYGTGALSVTSTGTSAGTEWQGIYAFQSDTGTDLTVNANITTGGSDGIKAKNYGTGALSVTSTGTSTGTQGDGINAYQSVAGTDLTVTANDTSGYSHGIFAANSGTGALSVTSTGTASATATVQMGGAGIAAYQSAAGTNLTVNANNTTSVMGDGILAKNYGTGALSVTSTGTATGTAGLGISAYQTATGTDLTVNAYNTTGGVHGIYAKNMGTGALSVTSTGTATGKKGDGIYAYQSASGTDLTVNSNITSGGSDGIKAKNFGTGALTLSSTGAATGGYGSGIYAYQSAAGTDLTVAATDTFGYYNGIWAKNLGAGALSVTSTGTATGDDGIYAYQSAAGTNLTVNSNDASGYYNGIKARSFGTGALSVTSTGTATGQQGYGINAYQSAGGTDLTVNANNTAGGVDGIYAKNLGTGTLSVTSTGTATGTYGNGIVAYQYAAGTDLTVNANDTSGNDNGIMAVNLGTGALSVTSSGTAAGTATNSSGIYAYQSAAGTDLMVNANNTSGDNYGIRAENLGTGSLSVTSTGTATGTQGDGIYAYQSAAGTDLTVNAYNTIGGAYGIYAKNLGTGALSVTSTGTATSAQGDGIYAYQSAAGTDLSVTVNSVTGSVNGITAMSNSAAPVAVKVSGTVQGGTGWGINTSTVAGTTTTIDLVGTAVVGATSGQAIQNNDGDSVLNVASGAAVIGKVQLGGGSDVANFNGAHALDQVTLLDGGDDVSIADGGIDKLNLTGLTASISGSQIINWEDLVLSGSNIAVSDGALTVSSDPAHGLFLNSGSTLNGGSAFALTGNMAIDASSTFVAKGAGSGKYSVSGTLSNLGTITLQDGVAGDALSVAGNYTGGGTLMLDSAIGSGKSDTLTIAGSAGGSPTNVDIKVINQGLAAGGFIPLITVEGGTPAAGAFTSTSLPKTGLVVEKLVQNPADAHQFGIQQNINPGAPQLAALSTLAGSVSALLDEPVGPYVADRSGRDRQISLWMRNGAGSFDQNVTGQFNATGFNASLTDRVHMNYTTAQFGLDYAKLGLGGGAFNLHLGVTGGIYGASAHGTNGRTKIESSFVGGYANLNGRHFTFDVSLRHEARNYTMVNASLFAAGSAKTKGTATSGSIAGSYSLGLGSALKLVPSASYTWGVSKVDAFTVDSLSTVTPGRDHQGVGRFGAKLMWGEANAYWMDQAKGWSIAPYVGAYAVRNFSPGETGSAAFGSSSLNLQSETFKNAVQYSAGISGHDAAGKINLFLQGSLYRGGGVDAASVSGGLRFNF